MGNFLSFTGTVTHIEDIPVGQHTESECYKRFTVEQGADQTVDFTVAPTTYFADHAVIATGDTVTGFYDADAPAILIYPPQYSALVISKETPGQFVMVSQFDEQLTSTDGSLQLNLADDTPIVLPNGQPFNGSLANRDLIVTYGRTTRSIPAQTTPSRIVVLCRHS
ncbi:hypothetical protein NCCP2716_11210 [Sporosarcina sp. NCCP-2716]|uniref:hypothetical protein n=1 Tax=Sporosarcina sp. NCCP-2716 TaxID=2943679 RepID=UPI002040BC25|nr:hypothetical protein [Sporosarcina sp. NCCP-2716]GKV68623.1 hypothetical protein NCCP2716_11210 [Sporosarcina sp. NCCP-2716]